MRLKVLAARAFRSVFGEGRYRSVTGQSSPQRSRLLGDLADPEAVPDPLRTDAPAGIVQEKPRDEIVPIYDPQFVPPSSVDWAGTDLVIGVANGHQARAYPVGALNKREMVLDNIGGVPIVVTWCPRCGTGMVHRREVDGAEIVLGNQGALYNEAMTWWDHDTGTVWSQPTGEAVAGPRKGKTLELIPSTLTSWRSWKELHPDTVALKQRTRASRYELGDLSIGVTVLGETVAYPMRAVRNSGIINDVVGGTPISVIVDGADQDKWTVVSRSVGGKVVGIEWSDGALVDATTKTQFVLTQDGGLHDGASDRRLRPIAAFTVHPKDFNGIWPEGRTWTTS